MHTHAKQTILDQMKGKYCVGIQTKSRLVFFFAALISSDTCAHNEM